MPQLDIMSYYTEFFILVVGLILFIFLTYILFSLVFRDLFINSSVLQSGSVVVSSNDWSVIVLYNNVQSHIGKHIIVNSCYYISTFLQGLAQC